MRDFLLGHYAYAAAVLLMVIGLYAILVKRNLVKKLNLSLKESNFFTSRLHIRLLLIPLRDCLGVLFGLDLVSFFC